MSNGKITNPDKSEVLQGTLDLMVLKVLDALGIAGVIGRLLRLEGQE